VGMQTRTYRDIILEFAHESKRFLPPNIVVKVDFTPDIALKGWGNVRIEMTGGQVHSETFSDSGSMTAEEEACKRLIYQTMIFGMIKNESLLKIITESHEITKAKSLEEEKRNSFANGSAETISAIKPVFDKMLAALKAVNVGDIDPYVHGGHYQILEAIKEAEELGL